MQFKFEIQQSDIDQGTRCSSDNCPIARAIERETGKQVSVTKDTIVIWDARGFDTIETPPKSVTRFVEAFDAGDPVEPFSFRATPTEGCRLP